MKFKYIIILMLLMGSWSFISCDKEDINSLVYDDSSFTEIRMYLREIVDDHTSRKDLTESVTVDKDTRTVNIVVKYDSDLTQLYGIATLARGCTVSPVADAPEFGEVGDYSGSHKYLVESKDGVPAEWTVTVTLADPPEPVIGPSGFELVHKDAENKHLAFESQYGDLQYFNNTFYGHSYDGTAESFSKLVDDPDLNFKNAGDFSISFRVKTAATNSDPSMMSTQNWNSSGNTGFTIAFRGDNWRVAVSDGAGNKADSSTSGVPFNDGSWHVLVVTFDRDGNMTMYQDGNEVASADMSAVGSIDSGNPIYVAQDGTGSYGVAFTGDIADCKIYDYVLTSGEVSGL